MRFGLVLPTWIYNDERLRLARPAFASLRLTKCPTYSPYLLVLHKGDWDAGLLGFDIGDHGHGTSKRFGEFMVFGIPEPPVVSGTEQTLAYGTEMMLEFPEVSHIVWMGDDALFNPDWLIELEALIERHPSAVSWSVYHSAYQGVHRDLEVRACERHGRGGPFHRPGYDVLVRSICGHGMTFTREEWTAWGVHWTQGKEWSSARGTTLDMHHACNREGERWVTKESYVEHTGRSGKHCIPEIPEYATEFVGLDQ